MAVGPAVHTVRRAQSTVDSDVSGTERWWLENVDGGRPGLTSCSELPDLSASQSPPERIHTVPLHPTPTLVGPWH